MNRILAVVLFLLMPLPLLAKDIYVATSGSDTNGNGTFNAPYQTIKKAQSVVACGDTIFLRGGTYAGTSYIGSSYDDNYARCVSYASPVTIRNYMSEHVIIQPGPTQQAVLGFGAGSKFPTHVSYFWKIIATAQNDITLDCQFCMYHNSYAIAGQYGDYVWLENLEVINGSKTGILPGGSDHWTMINLNVHNNGTVGEFPQTHGLYWDGVGLLIDGGQYHHNVGYGIQQFHSAASDEDDNVIRNVKIYNNNAANELGGGVIISTGHRNLIYNSLIYNNTGNGLDINYRCDACAAYNNTIYGNSANGIAIGGGNSGATNAIVKNNLLISNGTAITNSGTGSVIANNYTGNTPGFTNAAAGDFTIQSTSKAIGVGENLSAIFSTDFAGKPRAVGKNTFDAGAYEYSTTSADTTPPQVTISVITP